MSRAPVFDFTLGGKTLADLNVRHLITDIEFIESMDKFDTVKMVIHEGPALARATDLVKHGSVMQLSMGYVNEGVYPMTVVFLKSIEPDFANQQVTLTFAGYLKAMDVGERDRVLQGRTIREIVAEVIADYAVLEVGTIESGDTIISDTTTQSKQTDLSVLEGIASQFGLKWKVEPGSAAGKWALSLYKMEYDKTKAANFLPIHAYPTKDYQADTKSLKLKDFKPKSNILDVSSSVEIRSNNPSQPFTVTTETKSGTSNTTQVTGSEVVAVVFGSVTRIHFMENVTDEAAASIIAEQLQQQNELAFVVAQESQLSEGIPNLRVGDVRTVVPHGISLFEKVFAGEYLLTGTRHKISASSGYDCWATMAMNALTVPPPPAAGFGGGGSGDPVLIYVYPNSTVEGWHITFNSDGTPIKGTYITRAEVEANEYWMSHVMSRTAFFRINVDNISGAAGTSGTMMGGFTSFLGYGPAEQSGIPNLAYSNDSISQIPIDWPAEYNTDAFGLIGVSVRNPSGVGDVPYISPTSTLGFLAAPTAQWNSMTPEEREAYMADAEAAGQVASQQEAISERFAQQQMFQMPVVSQLMHMGGN
jgi:phage protein D